MEQEKPINEAEKRIAETLRIMGEWWQADRLGAVLQRPHPQLGGKSIIQVWSEDDTISPLEAMQRLDSGGYL